MITKLQVSGYRPLITDNPLHNSIVSHWNISEFFLILLNTIHYSLTTIFDEGENYMDTKTLLDLIANQGFPIALSILLIFRIDRFMQEIVIAQKDGYRQVLENTKEIHNTITNLNQQNREYYSLRFSEVQKELSGMKVELGKIE